MRSALPKAGYGLPNTRRIVLNLAPAVLPKVGGRFDLPNALGILVASGQVPDEALDGIESMLASGRWDGRCVPS